VTKHDEYLHYAEACLGQAKKGASDATRESWLQIAQQWLEMIPPDKAQELRAAFEKIAGEKGTGQDQSDLSH
jgi:hypothetical protein